jgi:hypothetical protein
MVDDLQVLKSEAVRAQQRMRQVLQHPDRSYGAKYLFECSGELSTAKKGLSAALEMLPDDSFALHGCTRDGRSIMLNKSAKRADSWQLTRFDPSGQPFGDTQYAEKRRGIGELLDDIEIVTLVDFDGLLTLDQTFVPVLAVVGPGDHDIEDRLESDSSEPQPHHSIGGHSEPRKSPARP